LWARRLAGSAASVGCSSTTFGRARSPKPDDARSPPRFGGGSRPSVVFVLLSGVRFARAFFAPDSVGLYPVLLSRVRFDSLQWNARCSSFCMNVFHSSGAASSKYDCYRAISGVLQEPVTVEPAGHFIPSKDARVSFINAEGTAERVVRETMFSPYHPAIIKRSAE